MFTIEQLHPQTIRPYLLLANHHLRAPLRAWDGVPGLVVCGACFWGEPVGLAVAESSPDGQSATLLDLYVAPHCRQAGYATRLLAALEQALKEAGCQTLHTVYPVDAHTPAFEKTLDALGWAAPITSQRLFWTDVRSVSLPWVQKLRFRPPYAVFPWSELTAAERRTIVQRGEEGWYPPTLSPFLTPDESRHPSSSIGLRYKDEVVGWTLTVRQKDALLTDVLFVSPELQRLGRGIMLVAESIRRQYESGCRTFFWRVSVENAPMLRWSEKAFGALIIEQGEERTAQKSLQPAT